MCAALSKEGNEMENITITLEEYRAMIECRQTMRLVAALLTKYNDDAARAVLKAAAEAREAAPC